jgi:hypothetical protein
VTTFVASARLVVVVALLATACAITPKSHRTEPYRSDPVLAGTLERRAAEVCATRRGANDLPPTAFKTDACSAWFDGSWKHCCVEHDIDYWCGGNADDRLRADRELRNCVAETTCGILPDMMQAGVRIGGAPWLPTPWRWGYGWGYYRAYDHSADHP